MINYDYSKALYDRGFPQDLKPGDWYYDFYGGAMEEAKETGSSMYTPKPIQFTEETKPSDNQRIKMPSLDDLMNQFIKEHEYGEKKQ